MNKADKIFAELGYEKENAYSLKNELVDIIYNKYYSESNYYEIRFFLYDKTVGKSFLNESTGITMQELKAINEKVKELRLAI